MTSLRKIYPEKKFRWKTNQNTGIWYNFLRKLIILVKYICFTKFIFQVSKKKIIIFDCKSPGLRDALSDFNYFVLSIRTDRITKIYVSKKIILFLFFNFFKKSLKQNYFIALIKEINPKIVITTIDNSEDFYIISKYLSKDIKFIAVQRASRETRFLPSHETKRVHIPEYLCFANWDKNIYKKKTNIKSITPVGSLMASLAIRNIKKKKLIINKNQYDVCLIAEAENLAQKDPVKRDADGFVTTLPDATGTLAEFTHRFCKKYKLKIVFASRSSKFSRQRKEEEIFYKIYLKNYNFKLARLRNKYSTYIYVMKSRVVIGLNSSIVREALGLNKKIFHCNFTGFSGFNYPTKFKFSLNKNSYAIFEKELLKILAMSNLKYFKTLGKEKNLVMHRCDKTLGLVRNKVAKYLLS